MICRSRTTASLILVSVALGCSSHEPLERPGSASLGLTTTDPRLECPKTNVLVRMPYWKECPSEIGTPGTGLWVGGAVMTNKLEGVKDPGPRFCTYYWKDLPSAPKTGVLQDYDWQWDCASVGAHANQPDLYAALAAHGKENLGKLTWTSNVTAPVRVAVIDTAAGSWSDPDNNPHGKAVGTLIRDTACLNPTSCPVDVVNYLGLPLLRAPSPPGQVAIRRDDTRGGAFGAHGDLARAIVQAVDENAGTRTVINLSVAYDSVELLASGAPDPADFENSVVFDALQYARCNGALILAAAGNGRVPAIGGQKAALPARWTERRAFSASTCNARYGVANHVTSGPLLYGVSAVDFGTKPLLTTRGEGQSVLAALGFAVVRDDPNGGYTRILSGTSMATATVSAIAAALWARTPAISPDRIIRELYAVSPSISETADFHPAQPQTSPLYFTDAHLITRCSIADSSFGVATCEPPSEVVSTVPDSVVPDLPQSALQGKPLLEYDPEPGIYPLDYPWIRPQPESQPGCTSCSVKLKSNKIDLVLRSGFSVKGNALRLLVKKSSAAGIAGFAQNLTGEETVAPIADFNTESVPFTVNLDDAALGTPSAAELSYQIEVDNVTVDLTESVLLEPETEVAQEF
jgi:hypothetical protein